MISRERAQVCTTSVCRPIPHPRSPLLLVYKNRPYIWISKSSWEDGAMQYVDDCSWAMIFQKAAKHNRRRKRTSVAGIWDICAPWAILSVD
jgi:hypothetical protein